MGGEDGVHSVTLDSGETESEAIMPKHFQDEPLMMDKIFLETA